MIFNESKQQYIKALEKCRYKNTTMAFNKKKHRQKREIGEGKLYGLIRHSTKMYRQHRQDILTVTRQTFFKGQKATQTV